MASIMLFPNVATHRRMPHLSKEPKETTTPKPTDDASLQQQQQITTVLPPHSSALPASIDRTDNTNSSSSGDNAHPSKAIASTSTTSAAGKNLLTLNTNSTPHGSGSKSVANSASSSSTSLLIDGAGTGGHSSLLSTPTGSIASTPLVEHHHNNGHCEHESSLHGHGHGHGHRRDHSDHSPLHLSLLHNNHDKHQQQGHHHPPPNAPHGPSCISNNTQNHPLPLSGTTSCSSTSTSTSNESRLIKTALYDAFGCLYHPVQHTHSSSPCSPSGHCGQPGTSKTSMCAGGSQVQVTQHTLRSGEVTPLISPSPRAMSPMIRPHLGLSSAPITPLELSSSSEDGISSLGSGSHGHGGAGYFGTVHGHGHGHGSGPGASPSLAVSSSRQLHQHLSSSHHYAQHHHGIHQHPLPPVPQYHPSSVLNRTGSFNKHTHSHGHTKQQHQQDGNHLHPHPHNTHSQHEPTHSNGPSLLARKSSLGDIQLDPTEHPVLCSLQTLSLTHPHPANHYHPHLGHDLGHDRVSISSSPPSNSCMASVVMPLMPSGVLTKTTERS
ncbi:MAG: hypothetical protein J3R72DRAFT_450882 [Linnemannia gamsii]|nr:MAG: hypothetical protein J3R72DRAFT_450882 [Linnemannia gamsii]